MIGKGSKKSYTNLLTQNRRRRGAMIIEEGNRIGVFRNEKEYLNRHVISSGEDVNE